MSTWTHVVGCIRVDGIPGVTARKEDIYKIIGPMCTYEKWDEASTLPRGSEGGLQYQIIEYADGLCWLAIPVWGDLRAFENTEEIVRWWNTLLKELGLVRDAVLHVQIEGQERVVLTHEA